MDSERGWQVYVMEHGHELLVLDHASQEEAVAHARLVAKVERRTAYVRDTADIVVESVFFAG
ncbi:MAG: hypothetical protein ACHREM_05315 [Polyangiales bacterium]